jgi:NADH-quinone oxidoreductase subunit K
MKLLIILSFFFFIIGLVGILFFQKNFLIILLCLELMILGCALNFLVAAKVFNDPKGQLFTILLLTVSTAETAIGISLFIKIFQKRNSLDIYSFKKFKY